MKKFKIAYFGSSDFSADFLEKLLIDKSINRLVNVKFVVTQPDRPVGRKQISTPTPVKTIAKKYDLEVLEIENLKLNENCKLKIENLDICLVYAYANIIPKELLIFPKYGFWCLHPSLLPKYRGTSPMATTLINGDKKTGMTIIKMDEQIDHGPIIAQENLMIEEDDKRPDLEKKLTDLGFQLFVQSINQLYIDNKNIILIFAGPFGKKVVGENKYYMNIISLLKKNKIKHKFLGNLSANELTSFYETIDLLILPSINQTEAFGIVQVEAMLSGTPVVASNLPGVRVPIQLTKMGKIVAPKNPKQLSQAISEILKNKNKFNNDKLIKNAKNIFDINNVFKFYDNLINNEI